MRLKAEEEEQACLNADEVRLKFEEEERARLKSEEEAHIA